MTTLRRFFSQAKATPLFLKARNGDTVPYPPNAVSTFEHPIHAVGINALTSFLPEHTLSHKLSNQAQYQYLRQRDALMVEHRSKWLAISSDNCLVIGTHEQVVRDMAEAHFRGEKVDYFMGCLGSEVMMEVNM